MDRKSLARPATLFESSASRLPLVEEDGLFFHVAPARRKIGPSAMGQSQSDLAGLAPAFRAAFAEVWRKIPGWDRQRLLAYWRRGPDWGEPRGRDDGGRSRPLIQIGRVRPSLSAHVGFNKLGHELYFSRSLVMAEPHLLRWEIARTLAHVFRVATCEHWRMALELIDRPLERWQREQGAEATDERREEKLDVLEAGFLEQLEKRIGEIVRHWEVEEPEGEAKQVPAST